MNNQRTASITLDRLPWVVLGMVAGVAALLTVAAAILPPAIDWDRTYVPASEILMAGHSPYRAHIGFYYPPWTLAALLPFAADPVVGRAGIFLVSLLVYALVAFRIGATPVSMGLFLVSPPVLHSLLNGNLEWLCLLGLALPPRWGLFCVLVKPQVSGGVAVYWLVEAWREGSWRRVLAVFGPVTLAFLGSIVLFGPWPLQAGDTLHFWWNASLWPWSLPVGVLLLGWGIRRHSIKLALAASPLLSPYVLFHAWAGAVLALAGHPRLLTAVVVGLWLWTGWRALS